MIELLDNGADISAQSKPGQFQNNYTFIAVVHVHVQYDLFLSSTQQVQLAEEEREHRK